eukprot:597210-Rhodomonas_salina.2
MEAGEGFDCVLHLPAAYYNKERTEEKGAVGHVLAAELRIEDKMSVCQARVCQDLTHLLEEAMHPRQIDRPEVRAQRFVALVPTAGKEEEVGVCLDLCDCAVVITVCREREPTREKFVHSVFLEQTYIRVRRIMPRHHNVMGRGCCSIDVSGGCIECTSVDHCLLAALLREGSGSDATHARLHILLGLLLKPLLGELTMIGDDSRGM